MKNRYKIILSFFLSISTYHDVFSQQSPEQVATKWQNDSIENIVNKTLNQKTLNQKALNQIKYWYYRERLKYFQVPGMKMGESNIISVRNKIAEEATKDNVDYGQPGKHTALFIGTLATEYYLLYKNGQYWDAANTEKELYFALFQIKQYWDYSAEQFYGSQNSFNGFFVRSMVSCDFFNPTHANGVTISGESHLDLLNKNLSPGNAWNGQTFGNLPLGHPSYVNHRTTDDCGGTAISPLPPFLHNPSCDHPHQDHPESMSQDEAIGILLGVECAIRFAPGTNSANIALHMKEEILETIINIEQTYGDDRFRIYEPRNSALPDYRICNAEGGNTKSYGKPFVYLYYLNPNLPGHNPDIINWITNYQKILWAVLSFQQLGNTDLVAMLAAMTDTWANTGLGIFCVTEYRNWDSFYTLLWEALQNKSRPAEKQAHTLQKSLDQLNAAPCEGPYCYRKETEIHGDWQGDGIFSGGGWASDYKWFKENECQDHGDWYTGNYNGTDYMILYNLYHMIDYVNCPYYVNYVDRTMGGYLPMRYNQFNMEFATNAFPAKIVAFNSLKLTTTIGLETQPDITNKPGHVTYVAGTEILLEDGFTVMPGAYCHAYIDQLHCNEYASGYKGEQLYPNGMYTPILDSLISLPKTPYDLSVEEDTGSNDIVVLNCPLDTIKFMGINNDSVDWVYTYFWDFGNGIISNEVNPSIYYNPGTYNFTLIITDTIGTSDTIKLIIEVPDCVQTGTKELFESIGDISIIPNPNKGEMWLISNNILNTGSRIILYDIVGREVYEKTLTEDSDRIYVNTSLINGVYLYSVISPMRELLEKGKLIIF